MIGFKKLGNYGRLGNQLFQIASVVGTALKNNEGFILPEWKYEKYFNVPKSWFDNTKLELVDSNLNCYLQDYNNFENIKNDIILYFKPSQLIQDSIESIKNEYLVERDNIEYVGIGVRRTDYLKYPTRYPIPSIEYYTNSINFIKKQRPNKKIKTICFSDDIRFCISNAKDFNFDLYFTKETELDVLHLQLMSLCDHYVIANSTFHWWAAYLSQYNSEKIVIYPIHWLGKDIPNQPSFNLFYPDWYGFDNTSILPINSPNNIVMSMMDGIPV